MEVFKVFGSNVPLVVLINPCKCQEFPLKGKTEAHFGQNTPKLTKMGYVRNARVASASTHTGKS